MFSSYLTGNALQLHYKHHPVNSVREIIAFYFECSGEKFGLFLKLNKVSNVITTAL